jgi:hypothetical protein
LIANTVHCIWVRVKYWEIIADKSEQSRLGLGAAPQRLIANPRSRLFTLCIQATEQRASAVHEFSSKNAVSLVVRIDFAEAEKLRRAIPDLVAGRKMPKQKGIV